MLRRTIHAARYLSDPPYRRGISRQLNKGGWSQMVERRSSALTCSTWPTSGVREAPQLVLTSRAR